jgi:hypothetical protein
MSIEAIEAMEAYLQAEQAFERALNALRDVAARKDFSAAGDAAYAAALELANQARVERWLADQRRSAVMDFLPLSWENIEL